MKKLRDTVLDRSEHIFADNDLPVEKDKAALAFGKEVGDEFFAHQFVFSPVVLEEGHESVYVGVRKYCRLPFRSKRQEIGEGAYSMVYRVEIENGHIGKSRVSNRIHVHHSVSPNHPPVRSDACTASRVRTEAIFTLRTQ